MNKTTPNTAGFTLPELIVVMVLTVLLSGLLFQFALGYSRYAGLMQANSIALVERLTASDYLRENLGMASILVSQTSIDDPNARVPDTSNPQYWKIIQPLGSYPGLTDITLGNSTSVTPIVYFDKHSRDSNGAHIKNGLLFYDDEYVLYHDGPRQELRVRTLKNAAAPDNRAVTSCNPGSGTPTCPEDKLLISNIASVKLRYFSKAGNLIDIRSIDEFGASPCAATSPYASCRGGDFSVVEVVEITLNLVKKPTGDSQGTTQSATVIRVALRNKTS